MKILILSQADVEKVLPMGECIDLMAVALLGLARGEAYQPLRMIVRPPGAAGLMALMPAYQGGAKPAFGLKAVGVFPKNVEKGKDAHQGSVMLYDGETGELKALMNASAVTAIRTAAVASRRPESARAFVEEMAGCHPFPIEAVASGEAALKGADLIVTATNSAEPVVQRAWVAAGAHLNVVGASLPAHREVDGATMAAARLFVDRRESTLNEAGDYLFALKEGAIGPNHIRAEIGELLLGSAAGRTAGEEITLFKSLGLAVEDLAAAAHVDRRARETGVGAWAEF